MIKRVLVPLDTSAFAEQALPHALVLARKSHANVHLVCVASTLPAAEVQFAEAETYLRKLSSQLEQAIPGVVTYEVLSNEPGPLEKLPPVLIDVAYLISRRAQEMAVDLIVMASHGRGGVRRAWLGSVADALVRTASRPILLIRPKDETFSIAAAADPGINHIVIPLDGSESAEQAIPFAVSLGSVFGARYTLLHVLAPIAWGRYPAGPSAPNADQRAVNEYLERTGAAMREQGMDVATDVVEDYSAGTAIVEFAMTHGVDVITISTTGAGAVCRTLLGSVADEVVRGGVPVLVCNIRGMVHVPEPEYEVAGRDAVAT